MFKRVVMVGFVCIATGARAEPERLTDKTISAMVKGATVQVDAPLGMALSVRFTGDGKMSAEAGGLAPYLGSKTDQGRWWVHKDRLCHKWTTWFEAKLQCLSIVRDGLKLHWTRDDGETGTATLVAAPEVMESVPAALGMKVTAPAVVAAAPIEPSQARLSPDAPTAEAVAEVAAPPVAPPPVAVVKKAQLKPKDTAKPAAKPAAKPVQVAAVSRVVAPIVAAAKPAAAPIAPEPTPITVAFRVTGVLETDVLNVRQGPSADARVVGAIPPHSEGVRLTGHCEMEWCPVVYRGVAGWVHQYYLIVDEPRSVASRRER